MLSREAGLLDVKDATGRFILAGRHAPGFSNIEEVAAGLDHVVPFAAARWGAFPPD